MRRSDFSRCAIKQYTSTGRHFLKHIARRGIRLKSVRPDDVETYLRVQRQAYRRRHGRFPADEPEWRSRITPSAHMLLRLAQGVWPPLTALESRVQDFKETLQQERLRPGHDQAVPGSGPLVSGVSGATKLDTGTRDAEGPRWVHGRARKDLSETVRPFTSSAGALAL